MVKSIAISLLASVTGSSVLLTVLFQVLPPEINGVAAWIITTLIGVIGTLVLVIRYINNEAKTVNTALNAALLQSQKDKTEIVKENAKHISEMNADYKVAVTQVADKLTELANSVEELGSAQSTAEAIRKLAEQLPKT